jgi:hypothetical protein
MSPNERLVENNTAEVHVPRIKLESYQKRNILCYKLECLILLCLEKLLLH